MDTTEKDRNGAPLLFGGMETSGLPSADYAGPERVKLPLARQLPLLGMTEASAWIYSERNRPRGRQTETVMHPAPTWDELERWLKYRNPSVAVGTPMSRRAVLTRLTAMMQGATRDEVQQALTGDRIPQSAVCRAVHSALRDWVFRAACAMQSSDEDDAERMKAVDEPFQGMADLFEAVDWESLDEASCKALGLALFRSDEAVDAAVAQAPDLNARSRAENTRNLWLIPSWMERVVPLGLKVTTVQGIGCTFADVLKERCPRSYHPAAGIHPAAPPCTRLSAEGEPGADAQEGGARP